MRIEMESTGKVVTLNGVPARVWEGKTAAGIPCLVFVTRVAVANEADSTEFDRELQEHRAPSAEVEAIPLRMIL